MLLETIFAPFVKERPICVMARAVLERLLDAPRLDALFARTAQQPYTRELLFSSLVQLMSEVVLGVHPTVHAVTVQVVKTGITPQRTLSDGFREARTEPLPPAGRLHRRR